MCTIIWWLVSGNIYFFFFSKCKRQENKEYEAFKIMWILTKIYLVWVHICASGLACWSVCMYIACLRECVGACVSIWCVSQCVCVLAGQSAIVQQRPQGLLLPPTRHNKEQLNAAALPAEEPTASHTSTNRQICLKPKGRGNKSQPTESNPLQSPSADSNQKVTGWLHPITHYHRSGRITIRCAVLHAKLAMTGQWCITLG